MASTLRSSRIVAKVGLAVAAGALLAGAYCVHRTASQGIPPDEWAERVRAGWVGKLAAGSGALPTEMWHKDQIRRKYGELSTPPQTPTPRGPLDDTTLALLGWQAARDRGPDFTSADVAAEWVEHLPEAELQGGGFGREFLDVLKRLRQGEAPPVKTGTPRAEWIAAQMRAEIWGMLAPGDAARAADYAERDASIFNTGNGVYAAQFVAAMASRLMVDPDIPSAISAARAHVPDGSDLARVIDDVIAWQGEAPDDWEAAWDRFVDAYRDRGIEQDFAAWNDQWLVETGGWPEAEVLDDYLGERMVLRSHPFGETEPARLTTVVAVPATGGQLRLRVTCNERPADVDWLMRVKLGETVHEEPIHWIDGRPQWQDFSYDLKPWAGQTLTIVLENAVLNKFGWEAGFWASPQLLDADGRPLRGGRPEGLPYRYPLSFEPMILPETFSVLTGLLYGKGDFRRSVSITTMCGFDTDCNAGTVGCLLGLRDGLDAIPAEWKDPIGDTYELQVAGLPRQWSIAELARQIAATGAALAEGRRQVGSMPEPERTPARAAYVAPEPVDPPEGFGAASRGGEGGRVIVVTTLADSGPGSLREALAAHGPRIVLFGVEGTIELQSRLRCEDGRITIDGGSAPGQGITLLNHGIQFRGDADDIIVRNLRIRVLTGGAEGDCLLFWGNQGGTVERVLVDHCSLMWATDEVVNTWGNARDITVQWTIIAEAQDPHSKGWLSGEGSDRVSIHHCLFAHNADRNPKLEGGLYDVVNNVIYNWGHNNGAKLESGARVNLINNCFIPGPDSTGAEGCFFPADANRGTRLYLQGNVGPYTLDGTGDQWPNVTYYEQVEGRWVAHRPAPTSFRADSPFSASAVAAQPAPDACDLVLERAGARVRDADDLRVIGEVRSRTGLIGRGSGRAVAAPQSGTAPAGGPRTGKFTLMALGDNSAADLAGLSHRYDLMIASHSVGRDVIDRFRRGNPGALVFCYVNTSDVNSDWLSDPYYARLWNDTNPHEDWFHHDSNGDRVRIYFPKYKNRCAFDTGNADLQRYLAGRVVETLQKGLYDGIQLDNVSTEFPFKAGLVGKWISAVPVDLTPEQYTADEVGLLTNIMEAAAGAGFDEKTIIFNHMRSGEPQESRAYVAVTDGANCESWLSQRTDPEGRWGWQAKVEQVREVNRLGKLTNLLCVPSQLSEEEARFCFASYLMALEGDRAYFFYGTNYKIVGQQNAWYPFYDVDLGAPQGDCESRDGAYWRPFSGGAVVVNPTASPVTLALPERYVTLSGEEVERLTLGPKQGALLKLPGG